MERVVYVDVLFAVNFLMDLAALAAAGVAAGRRTGTLRLAGAAALGGIYSLAAYLPGSLYWCSAPAALAVSAVLTLMAFGFGRPRAFLSVWGFFAAALAVLGGGLFALYFALGRAEELDVLGGVFYVDAPALLAPLLAVPILLFWRRRVDAFQKKAKTQTARISITYRGKTAQGEALVDTGLLLMEPASSLPCVVAEEDFLSELLPPGFASFQAADAEGIRFVPYRTAAGSGVFPAFVPDELRVDGRAARAAVAVSAESLSGGEYRALVPAALAAAGGEAGAKTTKGEAAADARGGGA